MPYRDPRCVHVAGNLSEAETTVAYLASRGIEAKVIDGNSAGLLDGVAGLAGSSSRGVEVWADPAEHEEAARLLAELAAKIAKRAADATAHGPLEIVCESCGKKTIYPSDLYGTIQDCPKCGSFMDVGPAEEIDWESEIDEPGDEGEEDDGVAAEDGLPPAPK